MAELGCHQPTPEANLALPPRGTREPRAEERQAERDINHSSARCFEPGGQCLSLETPSVSLSLTSRECPGLIMKGVNHGEEGNRHIIQVYYQHNLGKDNQARPCFFSSAGPGGAVLGWPGRTAGGRERTYPWDAVFVCLFFFFSESSRMTPSDF